MNNNDAEAGVTCVGNECQCMEHMRGASRGPALSKDCIHLEPVLGFNNKMLRWNVLLYVNMVH